MICRLTNLCKGTFQALFYDGDKLNQDALGKMVDERNLQRAKGYLDDARAKGAEVVCGGEVTEEALAVHPTILTNIPEDTVNYLSLIFLKGVAPVC